MKSLFFLVITVCFHSAFGETVNAGGVDWSQAGDVQILTGTQKVNSFKPGLPSCDDLANVEAQGLTGVNAHYNTPCIGEIISGYGDTQITLSDALIDRIGELETLNDLKKLADKYPVIKAVAVVAALCRPTGAAFKPTGAYCRYSGKF